MVTILESSDTAILSEDPLSTALFLLLVPPVLVVSGPATVLYKFA